MSGDNSVLVGVGRSGDFVHQGQTMSADVGFKCVSRLWYDKTMSIGDGLDRIEDEARSREDLLCPVKHMQFRLNDDNTIVLEYIDGREFSPTSHAWNQIVLWLDVSRQFFKDMTNDKLNPNGTVKYKRDRVDAEVLLNVLRNGYRRINPDKQFRFRTYTDGTLRAMLSEIYGTIDNRWYLETIAGLFKEIGQTEPRLSHWRGDADTIYGNVLIPDTCRQDKDSDYGGMFNVSNCEIGKRVLAQYPSVFRAICMNGCIWDQSKGNIIRKVHRGEIDYDDLKADLVHNIHSQIPLMSDAVSRFLNTKDMRIAAKYNLKKTFANLAKEFNLSYGLKGQASEVVNQFVTHESDNLNLFGMINAVTRAGQEFDNEEWVRLDKAAGDLMAFSANRWESFLERGNLLESEEVDKVFGTVAV